MHELYVFWFGLVLTVEMGVWWWQSLRARRSRSMSGRAVRLLLLTLPLVLLSGLALSLRVGAADEVQGHTEYFLFFLVLGMVWLAATVKVLAWLGISVIDDAIERDNAAAGWAVIGAMAGGTTSYTFANFGEGDTIWTTLGPAALGLVACMTLWAVHQSLSGASDAIGIERDVPSGLRFAGMALGSGMIVGRSMAGDYVSADATYRDLWQQGWPALVLVALAIIVQRYLTPTVRRDRSALVTGALPAVAYATIGVIDVLLLGPWSTGAHS